MALIEHFKTDAKELTISELMQEILEETGYIESLKEEGSEEAESRIENIDELISKITAYEETCEDRDEPVSYTHLPKAILHTHQALMHSAKTEQNHHGQTKDDVFLCIPPLYHTGAKMHWFGSLLTGGKAVLLKGTNPEFILRAVAEEKCTIVWLLVPWAQDLLLALDSGKINLDMYQLDQWRLMHIGAQPVPPSLIKHCLLYTSRCV